MMHTPNHRAMTSTPHARQPAGVEGVAAMPDETLLAEIGYRYADAARALLVKLDQVRRIDWLGVADRLLAVGPHGTLPMDLRAAVELAEAVWMPEDAPLCPFEPAVRGVVPEDAPEPDAVYEAYELAVEASPILSVMFGLLQLRREAKGRGLGDEALCMDTTWACYAEDVRRMRSGEVIPGEQAAPETPRVGRLRGFRPEGRR
ncbi:MAG: hypothetical protein AAGA29_03620 [Planctomycetota bacterium]